MCATPLLHWNGTENAGAKRIKFNDDIGITEIAVILKRLETAIMQQIEKQDLYGRRLYPARQKNCSEQPKCLCDNCMADAALCPLRSGCRCSREGE